MQIRLWYIPGIIILLFCSTQAVAKTDQPADAATGAGGVTITGVTNTTDYQYRAPDLSVTAINGVPVNNTSSVIGAPPAPGSKGPSPEERGEAYDKTVRQSLNMPFEWFTCKTSDNCVTAHVPCNTGLAVNKQYKSRAEALICHGECVDACLASEPDTSQAICANGQCKTIVQPYQPNIQK